MMDEARFLAIKQHFKEMGLLEVPDIAFLVTEVDIWLNFQKGRVKSTNKYYNTNRDEINARRRARAAERRVKCETKTT